MLLRTTIFACLIGLPSLGTSFASGQDPFRQPKPSQSANSKEDSYTSARDLFFRTLRATRTHGAQDLTYLLIQKSVRDEVGMNEDGWREIRDRFSAQRAQGDKLLNQLEQDWSKEKAIPEASIEKLKSELTKIAVEADAAVLKILEKNQVTHRLIALFVQHRDASAAVNKLVAEKIELEESRRLEILEKREKIEREVFAAASEEFRDGASNPNTRRKIWEKVQKKIDMTISAELTSKQRALLEELRGKPFTFELPEPPSKRGPRGGPSRDHDKECDKPEPLSKLE